MLKTCHPSIPGRRSAPGAAEGNVLYGSPQRRVRVIAGRTTIRNQQNEEKEAKYGGNRIVIAICMALVFLVGARVGFAQTEANTAVATAQAKHLRQVNNLSEWFEQVRELDCCSRRGADQHTGIWPCVVESESETHVAAQQYEGDPPEYLAYQDATVKLVLEKGLAEVIEIHPHGDFEEKLSSGAVVSGRHAEGSGKGWDCVDDVGLQRGFWRSGDCEWTDESG
jgi:hypothetical protein